MWNNALPLSLPQLKHLSIWSHDHRPGTLVWIYCVFSLPTASNLESNFLLLGSHTSFSLNQFQLLQRLTIFLKRPFPQQNVHSEFYNCHTSYILTNKFGGLLFSDTVSDKQANMEKCNFIDVGQEIVSYKIWVVVRRNNKGLEVSIVANG